MSLERLSVLLAAFDVDYIVPSPSYLLVLDTFHL